MAIGDNTAHINFNDIKKALIIIKTNTMINNTSITNTPIMDLY